MDDRPIPAIDESAVEERFRIDTKAGESGSVLVLAGQISLDAVNSLKAEAIRLARSSGDVALDWRKCTHVSIAGLQILLALGAALAEGNRSLRVVQDNPEVRHFIELAGLSSHFPLAERKK